MAAITIETLKTRLTKYLNAEEAILLNKSYTIAGRTFTKEDLKDVQNGIEYYTKKIEKLERGGIRSRSITAVG